jgi:hypothetical protein
MHKSHIASMIISAVAAAGLAPAIANAGPAPAPSYSVSTARVKTIVAPQATILVLAKRSAQTTGSPLSMCRRAPARRSKAARPPRKAN